MYKRVRSTRMLQLLHILRLTHCFYPISASAYILVFYPITLKAGVKFVFSTGPNLIKFVSTRTLEFDRILYKSGSALCKTFGWTVFLFFDLTFICSPCRVFSYFYLTLPHLLHACVFCVAQNRQYFYVNEYVYCREVIKLCWE